MDRDLLFLRRQDALIDGLFNKASYILRNAGLTAYLEDGRVEPVLSQGLSPYLPDVAFTRDDGTIPNELECRIENLDNFRWGIEDNILKDEAINYVLDDNQINTLQTIVAIINDEISKTRDFSLSNSKTTPDNAYVVEDINGNECTISEQEASNLVEAYNNDHFFAMVRWTDEDIVSILEDKGIEANDDNIALVKLHSRSGLENCSDGWDYIDYTIEQYRDELSSPDKTEDFDGHIGDILNSMDEAIDKLKSIVASTTDYQKYEHNDIDLDSVVYEDDDYTKDCYGDF